jgi:hypothetical protein
MAQFNLMIPADVNPWPHELSAAVILSEYFQADVQFCRES